MLFKKICTYSTIVLFLLFVLTSCNGNLQRESSTEEIIIEKAPKNIKHVKKRDFSTQNVSNSEPNKSEQNVVQKKAPPKKIGEVKGIYLSSEILKDQDKFNTIIRSAKEAGLNALVLDIKDDNGLLTYDSKEIALVDEIQSDKSASIKDLANQLKELENQGFYTIARIVVFKDPYLASSKPKWVIKKANGTNWTDRNGDSWIDPQKKETWDYSISIAKEVTKAGFDEIQWDYVRLPDAPKKLKEEAHFTNKEGAGFEDTISSFLETAYKQLQPQGAIVSADVFGLTTTAEDDMGIGQKWEKITPYVDVISPMMYPSHYSDGSYGIKNPGFSPHQLITEGLKDALEKNKQTNENKDIRIRPWYQDFDMDGNYGVEEVKAQIQAGNELGVTEYLLWNTSGEYSFFK